MENGLGILSRRAFLYGSALAAGSATLAACSGGSSGNDNSGGSGGGANGAPTGGQSTAKGSAKKPLAAPKTFSEASALATQSKSGKLPKVADRLPATPYVVPHNWTSRGKYGGQLNMVVFTTTGISNADSCREFFYGYSLLRYLNDGADVGPGLVEKWTSNADASQWTFHFRKGLKWSDGQPFSTDDVLFWWEDIVVPGHYAQVPPEDCRSGKGTLVKMAAVDDVTLRLTFDAPTPLTADHIAAYTNGGIGKNGPIWVLPKHYLKAFHPKYNPKIKTGWDAPGGEWELKSDWLRNPDCPTLLGYKCKSFSQTSGVVLERNPYYWVVTKDGDQLPYIDEIAFDFQQSAQTLKLQVQQGKVDLCIGQFNQIGLADVSTLSQTTKKTGTEILLWNSGSGTGSIFFLNLDYPDSALRKVFNEPKFRQAISYAFNRSAIRRTIYFQTGQETTGTISPQSPEFQVGDGPKTYKQWRDAYNAHNPGKAKQLLAELGLKDTNGDGYVELPGGKKLTIQLAYSSDISAPEGAKDDQLVADCKAIGLHMVRVPIPPQAFLTDWENGQFMARSNWEVSNVAGILVSPFWLVPIENQRWAPLQGEYYSLAGTPAQRQQLSVNPWKRKPPRLEPEANGPVAQLQKLYDQTKVEPDLMKRTQLVWEMMKVHIQQGPFFMGSVANFPNVNVVKSDLQNVPRKENLAQGGLMNPWGHPTPAVYDPESFYWTDPTKHTS
jgi:peptide/nickel transport system substrate-binding protein